MAFSARRNGIAATIVVPRGNSVEKNAAVRALGGEVIEHGDDFRAASEYASVLAERAGMHRVPSFHPALVCGVASYCLEFLRAVPDLDVVYVPIGLGSGICAMIAARDALGLDRNRRCRVRPCAGLCIVVRGTSPDRPPGLDPPRRRARLAARRSPMRLR